MSIQFFFFLLHRPKEGMDFVQSYITHHVTHYHYYDKEIKSKAKKQKPDKLKLLLKKITQNILN